MATAISATKFNAQTSETQQYMRLPLTIFRIYEIGNIDLYCKRRHSQGLVLYRSANFPLSTADVDELERRGHKELFVTLASFAAIQKTLMQGLDEIVEHEEVAGTDRFAALQTAVAMEVDLAFQLIRPDKFVSLTRQVIGCVTKLFEGEEILARNLFNIVEHDFYTFTHVTNVAAYAILLAQDLGINDSEELRQIAEGAMLHDIGKRFIPSKVLCKKGHLNDEERQLMQMHPARGYIDLRKDDSLTRGQLMMVYQHHERVDGQGYPVRIMDEEIHPWAKILAVVDVFDALSSKRPYRDAISLEEALGMIQNQAGLHFDREIVRCWNSTIQKK